MEPSQVLREGSRFRLSSNVRPIEIPFSHNPCDARASSAAVLRSKSVPSPCTSCAADDATSRPAASRETRRRGSGNVGVLVRLAELLAFVLAIDGRDAGLADLVVGEPRLAAAADAAAGTGHHFDEMIRASRRAASAAITRWALLSPWATATLSVTPSRNFQSGSVPSIVSDASFTPFKPGDRRDVQIGHRQRPAGDDLVGRPQGGFHHAARVGEDVGGAGGKPQGGVHLFVGQALRNRCPRRGSSCPARAWSARRPRRARRWRSISGRWHSNFFAVQGMTETTKICSGRLPSLAA